MALWIDAFRWGEQVLCGGGSAWDDPAQLGGHYSQIDRLLNADIHELPIHALFDSHGSGTASQRAERVEAVAPRAASDAVVTGLRAYASAGPPKPLCLALPGPTMLVGEVGDDLEDARYRVTLALSDLVRSLAGEKIAWLLIDEPIADDVKSLARQAKHYGWQTALIGAEGSALFDVSFSAKPTDDSGLADPSFARFISFGPAFKGRRLVIDQNTSPEALAASLVEMRG